MKAPDKIYIHARTEPYPSLTWSEVEEKNATNEEYIRKKVLLDWGNSVLAKKEITPAMRIAMRGLISKLNSL